MSEDVVVRTAVVTGGSAGIGLATATRLLEQSYEVVITGRDEGKLAAAVEALGSPAALTTLTLDGLDYDATAEKFGAIKPDVLVANAGMGFAGNLAHTSIEDWQRVVGTNATSVFVAIKACVPHMLERGWGRIVTIGSLASHRPIRMGVAYTGSKHALWGLTRAVALDLAGTGVTSNLVAPAFVRTDMTRANAEKISLAGKRSVDEVEEQLAKLSDLGRLLEPEEVADAVAEFVLDGTRTGQIKIMGDLPDA